ncbi:MAG: hypothetical protein CV081_01425 [Nitrospira sp. LK265]|nr:hypothetical protein [Nitrospira sp.]NGZ59148.1 hypothetical protein [Nitrospira sp. LK265]
MKTRISAMICLLCVLGYAEVTLAEDPYTQRVADPYALSPNPPTMSSGTIEPYLSFMGGFALSPNQDATFTDGSQPTVISNVPYQNSFSVGGSGGIWFPTRNKLAGFDLGTEITGFLWYPDVNCCVDFYNNSPDGTGNINGLANQGTATEIQGIYVGANFLIRYPMAISDTYPNGRWHPYVGIGVGAHQMAMKPGGFRGGNLLNAITESRNTSVGFMGVGGVKAHIFKYLAAFVEAKYLHADHDGLTTDRYGNSDFGTLSILPSGPGPYVNSYNSTINTVLVHFGLSLHYDIKP